MICICWFAEQKQIIIVDWLCDGFFYISQVIVQYIVNLLILPNCFNCFPTESSASIKIYLVLFQEMDQTSNTNSHLSEMCAAHYNTVHGTWHQHPDVCRCIVKTFISNWSFTKKALVIFAIYRAMCAQLIN